MCPAENVQGFEAGVEVRVSGPSASDAREVDGEEGDQNQLDQGVADGGADVLVVPGDLLVPV